MRLIDADELKKEVESSKYIIPHNINRLLNSEINRCIEAIDNAPTVAVNCEDCDGYEAGYSAGLRDSERPQGEWICDYRTCKCSVCNFTTVIDTYNFCPNCGAQMKTRTETD